MIPCGSEVRIVFVASRMFLHQDSPFALALLVQYPLGLPSSVSWKVSFPQSSFGTCASAAGHPLYLFVLVVCVCLSEAKSLLVCWLNILCCGCKLSICYHYQHDFGYSTHPQANLNWKKYFLF